MNQRKLRFWTIYKHPADYPGRYVVRSSTASAGAVAHDRECELFDSPGEARSFIARIAPHAICVQRQGDDPDPVIFEVYV